MSGRDHTGRTVFLENIPFEEAKRAFLNAFCLYGEGPGFEETLPVTECLGRVLAQPVFARLSSPHYHAAAMDGVAVDAQATFGAREREPVTLEIDKTAFWVDTGDMLPAGTNAVIMVEHLHRFGEGLLEIIAPVAPWENVRVYGEDIVETELILPSNHLLRPVDLGAILAGGVRQVSVRKRPRVAIIPTGSELVSPDIDPKPGQIVEFNSTMLSAMVRQWGGIPCVTGIIEDELDCIKEAVERACAQSEIILIGAGSSHGREDYTARIIESLGEIFVHGVAIRPGKPVVLGQVKGKPAIGVPGYPVSAVIAMELFLKPVIEGMLGLAQTEPETVNAVLTRKVVSPAGADEFLRVKLGKVGDTLVATPITRGAALTTSLVRADGTVVVPRGTEGLMSSANVTVRLHKPLQEILGQVVIIGSHDLTLDIIADLLKRKHPEIALSSAHQGSLGGLIALRRQEAHMAGCHLLDEETGEYNIPFIIKYLPETNVTLVTLVYRQQGFIVAPGNPKKIESVKDLTRPDVQFVNRQKGSGTRLLLDYALKEKNIDSSEIQGYDREEFTHTQVAASVKSNAADAGLGILSAARALGLDFIPWREERYDLAIPDQYLDHTGVKRVLDLVVTGEFKKKVEGLGGYSTRDAGTVIWPRKDRKLT